jgi:hypothetical protein
MSGCQEEEDQCITNAVGPVLGYVATAAGIFGAALFSTLRGRLKLPASAPTASAAPTAARTAAPTAAPTRRSDRGTRPLDPPGRLPEPRGRHRPLPRAGAVRHRPRLPRAAPCQQRRCDRWHAHRAPVPGLHVVLYPWSQSGTGGDSLVMELQWDFSAAFDEKGVPRDAARRLDHGLGLEPRPTRSSSSRAWSGVTARPSPPPTCSSPGASAPQPEPVVQRQLLDQCRGA